MVNMLTPSTLFKLGKLGGGSWWTEQQETSEKQIISTQIWIKH